LAVEKFYIMLAAKASIILFNPVILLEVWPPSLTKTLFTRSQAGPAGFSHAIAALLMSMLNAWSYPKVVM
jgi:hypothetical protein